MVCADGCRPIQVSDENSSGMKRAASGLALVDGVDVVDVNGSRTAGGQTASGGRALSVLAVVLASTVFGCGARQPLDQQAKQAPPPPTSPDEASADAGAPTDASSTPEVTTQPTSTPQAEVKAEPCPKDMLHVKAEYCPKVERICLDSEYNKPNHITICHKFKQGVTRCLAPRRTVDVCIDRYEYPNQRGGHPPTMVDYFDAKRSCEKEGKRLCYEREWVAACEGPEEKPFPYGWERSAEKCNIDNPWINPSLERIYSKHPHISQPELKRLDQSVPSGGKPGCVSDFGVYDLTGNFDEWVTADVVRKHKAGKFAALKGGAWGHVRNACRPVTTSHRPEFRYYFVSFRCCKDPAGSKPAGAKTDAGSVE